MERARVLVRRGLRILVGTVGILLAIVVLGVLSLLLPPVRERVLAMAVNQAQARLPGEFAVEEAAWPSLGSIALTGVVWTDSGDTLVAVDTLAVAMDLGALLRRELHARRLMLTGVVFDLPALQAAFPPVPSRPPGCRH